MLWFMPGRGQQQLRVGRVSLVGQVYLVTTCTSRREPVFDCRLSASIVATAMVGEGIAGDARTLAYVVMPDHLHWLLQLTGDTTLQTVVGRLKGRTARRINRLRRHLGPLWQPGFHDHALRRDESLEGAAGYIIQNPVRAGLVESVDEYPFWDTVWHRRGMVSIGRPPLL